jgi:hypothetical protein
MRSAARRFSSEGWACAARPDEPACAEPPAATRRASVGLAVLARAMRARRVAGAPAPRSSPRAAGASSCGDVVERHPPELADVDAGEGDRERLLLQPLAVAHGQSVPIRKRATRRFITALCVVA